MRILTLEIIGVKIDDALRRVNSLETRIHAVLSSPSSHSVAKLQRAREAYREAVDELSFLLDTFLVGARLLAGQTFRDGGAGI